MWKSLQESQGTQNQNQVGTGERQEDRTAVAGQTEDDHSQDQHHRTEGLQSTESSQEDRREISEGPRVTQENLPDDAKDKIKWPQMTSKEWEKFDEDMEKILELTLTGPAEKKLEIMTRMIYTIGEDRFGVEEKQRKSRVYHPSRREKEIASIRRELRTLANRYRRSSDEERKGLIEIRNDLRKRLKELRNAERIRKNNREKNRKRAAFERNPYRIASSVLEGKRSGKLDKPREEVEAYLKETHSDETRDEPLGMNNRIETIPPLHKPLDTKEPTWTEIKEVVMKAWACSAPGPNKKCPKLLSRLRKLMRVIWGKRPHTNMLASSRWLFCTKGGELS